MGCSVRRRRRRRRRRRWTPQWSRPPGFAGDDRDRPVVERRTPSGRKRPPSGAWWSTPRWSRATALWSTTPLLYNSGRMRPPGGRTLNGRERPPGGQMTLPTTASSLLLLLLRFFPCQACRRGHWPTQCVQRRRQSYNTIHGAQCRRRPAGGRRARRAYRRRAGL